MRIFSPEHDIILKPLDASCILRVQRSSSKKLQNTAFSCISKMKSK